MIFHKSTHPYFWTCYICRCQRLNSCVDTPLFQYSREWRQSWTKDCTPTLSNDRQEQGRPSIYSTPFEWLILNNASYYSMFPWYLNVHCTQPLSFYYLTPTYCNPALIDALLNFIFPIIYTTLRPTKTWWESHKKSSLLSSTSLINPVLFPVCQLQHILDKKSQRLFKASWKIEIGLTDLVCWFCLLYLYHSLPVFLNTSHSLSMFYKSIIIPGNSTSIWPGRACH